MDYTPNSEEAMDGLYYINYGKVLAHTDFTAVTRLLAATLQQNPYMSLGDFFKNLGNADLAVLGDLVDRAYGTADEERETGRQVKDNSAMEELLLISQMLSRAEGTETANMEEVARQVEYFVNMIPLTTLERKGLIHVYYENMTFGAENGDKPLAEKL
jgi:hypothetical protein